MAHSYYKDQVITYKKKFYQAASELGGNFSKPDDLISWAIYEMFHAPSRTFVLIHSVYGLSVLLYTFHAIL